MLGLQAGGGQLPLGPAAHIVFEQPEPGVAGAAAQVEDVRAVRQRHHVAGLTEGEVSRLRERLETVGGGVARLADQRPRCNQQGGQAVPEHGQALCPVLLSRTARVQA